MPLSIEYCLLRTACSTSLHSSGGFSSIPLMTQPRATSDILIVRSGRTRGSSFLVQVRGDMLIHCAVHFPWYMVHGSAARPVDQD